MRLRDLVLGIAIGCGALALALFYQGSQATYKVFNFQCSVSLPNKEIYNTCMNQFSGSVAYSHLLMPFVLVAAVLGILFFFIDLSGKRWNH